MRSEARCPYCLDDLVGEEKLVRCSRCRTPHHAACFEEHGGCVAYGCDGSEAGTAGESVLIRRPHLVLGPKWTEVPLLPLEHTVVRYRSVGGSSATVQGSGAFATEKQPAVRIALESSALRFGQDLRGRVVVALARNAVVRRLEVVLHDESHLVDGSAERVLRAALLGRPARAARGLLGAVGFYFGSLGRRLPRLECGHHFFEIEIPHLFGWIVTANTPRRVAIEAVLQCLRLPAVRSQRIPIELAEAPQNGDSHRAYVWQLPVERRPRPPAPEPAARAPAPWPEEDVWIDPAEAERQWTADVRGAAVPPPRLSSLVDFSAAEPASRAGAVLTPRAAPEDAAPARPPTEVRADPAPPSSPPPTEEPGSAEVDKAARELARELAGTARPPAPPPAAPEKLPISIQPREAGRPTPPASRGWTLVPFLADGEAERPTGRMLRVRSIPREDLPPLRLSLEARERRDDRGNAGVEALVDVPEPLARLGLECRYELARATGTFLAQNGFPRVERAKLLGPAALDPACVTLGERVMALVTVEGSLILEARAPATLVAEELVVELTLHGLASDGTIVRSGTRTVRLGLGSEPPREDR